MTEPVITCPVCRVILCPAGPGTQLNCLCGAVLAIESMEHPPKVLAYRVNPETFHERKPSRRSPEV